MTDVSVTVIRRSGDQAAIRMESGWMNPVHAWVTGITHPWGPGSVFDNKNQFTGSYDEGRNTLTLRESDIVSVMFRDPNDGQARTYRLRSDDGLAEMLTLTL